MVLKKKGTVSKKKNATKALAEFELFARRYGIDPPHLHVSDPIPDPETLRKVFNGKHNGYARFVGHPDIVDLENWLCEFEKAAHCRVFSSGMGAISAAVFAAGEMHGPIHIVAILPLYGGTYDLLKKLAKSASHTLLVTFLYANDSQLIAKLYDAIGPTTRAILFEAAGNPTLTFPNIEEITHVAHKCVREIIVICDNTFHFGLFKPLKWGVDVAVASDTKYLVGESSWLMGHIAVSEKLMEKYPEFWKEAVDWSTKLGATLGPFEAWYTRHFCLPNVAERVKQQSRNALAIARFLESHRHIERVVYPGLESYPQRANALRYLETFEGEQYFGGMISFYLKNADLPRTEKFLYYLNNNTDIQHKASLGGRIDSVESPLLLSHAACDPYDNFRSEITQNNIRSSTGRAAPADITMEAFDDALNAVN